MPEQDDSAHPVGMAARRVPHAHGEQAAILPRRPRLALLGTLHQQGCVPWSFLRGFPSSPRLLFLALATGCIRCYGVKENLGGDEVFECNNCPMRVPRDLNGAAGIFARRLVLTVDPSLRDKMATTMAPAAIPAPAL